MRSELWQSELGNLNSGNLNSGNLNSGNLNSGYWQPQFIHHNISILGVRTIATYDPTQTIVVLLNRN